ncbi:lasso peptide biosynthesis B2 protein [Aurantiacibacter aquimixticola]|uniref:lasso peptide biosynthesis B2 protein n=1 Tax=Aurantiacibacter aquimixticola TaxID=1958945 RepID=UPI00140279EF|nr:lasso peptide biosynthesis B2 protein [Aurantiacibacter aquimixticola]
MILFTEITLSLAWARVLVRFVSFRRWRGLLGPIDGEGHAQDGAGLSLAMLEQASDIGRQVERVGSRVWFEALCLPRAMAARWVLARRGIPSRTVIGTRPAQGDDPHRFHAWLMVGDRVVTGGAVKDDHLAFARRLSPEARGPHDRH